MLFYTRLPSGHLRLVDDTPNKLLILGNETTRLLVLRCGSHRGVFPLTKRCHSFSILQARIGDRSVLSAAAAVATGMNAETVVGNMCSVGAGCLLRSATLDAFAVVGDGCVLEEGTIMEECSELLPGSVLPAGYRVPAGEVYGGAPAEFVRELSKYEAFERRRHANDAYASNTVAHRDEFLPNGGPWKESEARREELRELLDQKTFQEGQLPVPV